MDAFGYLVLVLGSCLPRTCLWALRGGGGNFGVLTELEVARKPLGPEVIGGVRMFSYERAAEILGRIGA